MMRFVFLFLLISISINSFSQKNVGDSWAKVETDGSGKLTVLYHPAAGLVNIKDGKMSGLCIDLLNEFVVFVKQKYNKNISIDYAGEETVFADFLTTVQKSKNVMGISNVTVTEERKKSMKFTPYFLSNPIVIITHKDAPSVNSAADISKKLSGYKAIVSKGSTYEKYAADLKSKYFPSLEITSGSSATEILKMVNSNAKLFAFQNLTELVLAQRNGLTIKRQNIDLDVDEKLAFIMPKSSDWDKVWNEFLTPEFRNSTKYRKMISEHFGTIFLSVVVNNKEK